MQYLGHMYNKIICYLSEIQIYLLNLATLFLTCHLWIKTMGENQEENMSKVLLMLSYL